MYKRQLDDYYLAETPGINDLFHQLIERTSTRLHVVITSRVMPGLPVARYRAGHALRELGMLDRTFNRTEAGTFLEQTHGLQLAPRELGLLLRHTEGWGAGLQLASLYLKDSHNTKDAIHGLSGDLCGIADLSLIHL